jgi:hypothetical protein
VVAPAAGAVVLVVSYTERDETIPIIGAGWLPAQVTRNTLYGGQT